MNDQVIGTIRTLVQALAGWLVAQGVMRWGIEVDSVALEIVLFGVATGAYRELVSWAGRRWTWFEWLNGWALSPTYKA